MSKQETFADTPMSALNASRCLTGAMLATYHHLDLLESIDAALRDTKTKINPTLWARVMESVAATRTALGQGEQ